MALLEEVKLALFHCALMFNPKCLYLSRVFGMHHLYLFSYVLVTLGLIVNLFLVSLAQSLYLQLEAPAIMLKSLS